MQTPEARSTSRSRSPPASEKNIFDGITPKKISNYSDINIQNLGIKLYPAKEKGQTPFIYIVNRDSGNDPVFKLQKDSEFGEIVFGMQANTLNAEKPHFMGGAPNNKKVESLDLIVRINDEQKKKLEEIDDFVITEAEKQSKEFFGKIYNKDEIKMMYSSCIRIDESGTYPPSMKMKVNLSGLRKYLTEVTFIDIQKNIISGQGWEFVQPLLGYANWRSNKCLSALDFRRIWISNRRFGITYTCFDLAVLESTRLPENSRIFGSMKSLQPLMNHIEDQISNHEEE